MGGRWFSLVSTVLVVVLVVLNLMVMVRESSARELHNKKNSSPNYKGYGDALMKSILFFEGQRSGPLPSSQRMKWRKDSALNDGHDVGVDLVGGYYDAGDNVKFNFPMAFTMTVLSWGVLEFDNKYMADELEHAKEAIKWGTDYLLKATSVPDVVYAIVGDPWSDHACWQRPEEMGTSRAAYAVDKDHPGSEVAAEIAAALASSSLVFKESDPQYSQTLLNRAIEVFKFADTYRGSINVSIHHWACPFYCDWSGYMDELIWGAAWLYKATKETEYLNYVIQNLQAWELSPTGGSTVGEFGWDNKHAGINVLMAVELQSSGQYSFIPGADKFVCTVLPDSPTNVVSYSPGGLMFKTGNSNLQNPASLSFLLVVYARHMFIAKRSVQCGSITTNAGQLIDLAKKQVDYILGDNPMKMSYMVGYGENFPQKIHHRGSVLPSMDDHPEHFACQGGHSYFLSDKPNPNVLIGAVVGGPAINDSYVDSRYLFIESEPTTYINAPLVGLFAYFNLHHGSRYRCLLCNVNDILYQ